MGSLYSPGPGGPAGRPSPASRRVAAAARVALAGLVTTAAVVTAAGCAASRTLVISATPPDAVIAIDGVDKGPGPVTARLRFPGDATHTVFVSRPGYAGQTLTLDRTTAADPNVRVDLKPQTKRVWFDVRPLPAIVKVDGRPIGDGAAASRASADLPFAVDAAGRWVPHVATAERPGYRRAERQVRFTDPSDTYALTLAPERKDVVVTTDPPGADVTVDGVPVGKSPARVPDLVIRTDPQTNEWVGQKVWATKPGYESAATVVKWDDGRADYAVKLGIKSKTVRVTTDPPDAAVWLGNRQLARDPAGAVRLTLSFPPADDHGTLPTHELTVTPPPGNAVLAPAPVAVGWDDGKTDYGLTLPLAPTTPTPLVRAAWAAAGGGRMTADTVAVDAPTRTDERPGVWAGRVLPPADGGVIDALATSPDGSLLAYAVVSADGGDLRSRVRVAAADTPIRPRATAATAPPATRPSEVLQPALPQPEAPRPATSPATTQQTPTRPEADQPSSDRPGADQPGADQPAVRQRAATAAVPARPAASLVATWVTDPGTVAMMPSFAPDGLAVLYAGSRDGGRTFGVYRAAVPAGSGAEVAGPRGDGGVEFDPAAHADPAANGDAAAIPAAATKPEAAAKPDADPARVTTGDPADLWPTLDSAPQPRMYVQTMVARTSRLIAVDPGDGGRRTDLGQVGDQPRVSPQADAVVFTRPDPRTGKRDLFLLRMGSAEAVNLTNSPGDDDADPAWSKDGSRLAYSSDRPATGAAARGGPASRPAPDRNIWVLEVGKRDKPQRVTSNPAWDDCPAWNGDGTVLYFRSNRGGEWAVWAIALE
jgi:hypothetical protein